MLITMLHHIRLQAGRKIPFPASGNQIYPEFSVTAREFFKTIKDDFQNNN